MKILLNAYALEYQGCHHANGSTFLCLENPRPYEELGAGGRRCVGLTYSSR
jgi:hypothetical protein